MGLADGRRIVLTRLLSSRRVTIVALVVAVVCCLVAAWLARDQIAAVASALTSAIFAFAAAIGRSPLAPKAGTLAAIWREAWSHAPALIPAPVSAPAPSSAPPTEEGSQPVDITTLLKPLAGSLATSVEQIVEQNQAAILASAGAAEAAVITEAENAIIAELPAGIPATVGSMVAKNLAAKAIAAAGGANAVVLNNVKASLKAFAAAHGG